MALTSISTYRAVFSESVQQAIFAWCKQNGMSKRQLMFDICAKTNIPQPVIRDMFYLRLKATPDVVRVIADTCGIYLTKSGKKWVSTSTPVDLPNETYQPTRKRAKSISKKPCRIVSGVMAQYVYRIGDEIVKETYRNMDEAEFIERIKRMANRRSEIYGYAVEYELIGIQEAVA